MAITWQTSHVPFMTPASCKEYGELVDSNEVFDPWPDGSLKRFYSSLAQGAT